MPDGNDSPDKRKAKKQYMFLGFPANPTGGPNPEMGSGLIFNPDMFKPFLQFLGIIKKKPKGTDSQNNSERDFSGR